MTLLSVTTCLVALVMVCVTSHGAWGLDLTLEEGANGTQVTLAVINRIRDRCVFPEDRLFLRRAAYVASRDGTAHTTSGGGQDGGIWQVTEPQFMATKNCSGVVLAQTCQRVLTELAVDWSGGVTWADMRRPLHSGLAAALLTLQQLNGGEMAGDVTLQAQFWATHFGGNQEEFSSLAANATNFDCSDKMDLLFVLDSSGSVSTAQFDLMKTFAADVAQVLEVGPDSARVADIVFGSNVQEVFGLSRYTTAPDVATALEATPKLGGGTFTDDAIDAAAVTLYDVGSGARSDAKKVMVLVTDGHSWKPFLTSDAAHGLRDRGTTVFAIGVGSYNLSELHEIASDPTCSHVLTLTDFSSISSLVTHIQTRACHAGLVLTPGATVSREIPETAREVVTEILNPGPGSVITASVTCGDLDVYLSYTETSPSAAAYDEHVTATHNAPVAMTTKASLGLAAPVYITLAGSRLTGDPALRYGCVLFSWEIAVQGPTHQARLVNGARDTVGRVELFANGSWGTVCHDNFGVHDAMVVCRMMGHEGLVPEVYAGGTHGWGSGRVLLDEVGCGGAEGTLLHCPHPGLDQHDCGHDQDVSVDCQPDNATTMTFARLVNGSRPSAGRLEVWNRGAWGTVCHDGFGAADAAVVCRMLNYTGLTPVVYRESHFGEGAGDIWLDDVLCGGSETSILLCAHKGLGVGDCTHWDDVGVDCLPEPETDSLNVAAIVGGVVGGSFLLALMAVGAACYKGLLGGKARVKDFKFKSQAYPGGDVTDRGPSRQTTSNADDLPIPGLMCDAPAMRMPRDTRLPPLMDNAERFPALRF